MSAGILLFILREDRVKRTNAIKSRAGQKVKKLSNDPFFQKNFSNPIAQRMGGDAFKYPEEKENTK